MDSQEYRLSRLYVTQVELRDCSGAFQEMCRFVEGGGFWTQPTLSSYSEVKKLGRTSPLISISRFEDGKEYLHDGHHRCTAVWLGGRKYLRSDEYEVVNWKYSDYLEIAPQNNWYTPFDPRTHVRIGDFAAFKKEAKERFERDYNEGVTWVNENRYRFSAQRTLDFLPELAKKIQKNHPVLFGRWSQKRLSPS